jgi:hypothetical protein
MKPSEQLAKIRALKDGWHNGEGKAYSDHAMDQLEQCLRRWSKYVPIPAVFPSLDDDRGPEVWCMWPGSYDVVLYLDDLKVFVLGFDGEVPYVLRDAFDLDWLSDVMVDP